MKSIRKIVFNPLVQLICAMALCSCYYANLTPDTIRFFLTISTCLRETLVFVLPFLLFSFIAVALSAIPREGMMFVLGLMTVVFISNFMNIMISGIVGFFVLSENQSKEIVESGINLMPFFELNLPIIASTSHALLAGIIVGFFNSLYPNKTITYII